MHKLRDAPGDIEADLKRQLEGLVGNGRLYVLGLGNTDRADDGAGIVVAENLKKPFPEFSFSEHDGVEGTVLELSEKDEEASIIFVDAANLNLRPGSIRIVKREEIRETEITTHRVAVALMASILSKSGKGSAVICIQPGTIEFRGRMTEQVSRSVDLVVGVLSDIMCQRDS
jgi:hydrogenase 3 maturation protease